MEDLYTYDTGNYSDFMGGSSFDSPPSSLDESAMTILAVMGIIALVIFILQIVAKWKIFTKADEHGWAALIPFYNTYVLYKITCRTVCSSCSPTSPASTSSLLL